MCGMENFYERTNGEVINVLVGKLQLLASQKKSFGAPQVAIALYARAIDEETFPRVVFKEKDSLEEIVSKIRKVLNTPIGKTENQLPGMQSYIVALEAQNLSPDSILSKSEAEVLYRKVAGGDPERMFFYFEEGRAYSWWSAELFKGLRRLKGGKIIPKLKEIDRKLLEILELRQLEAEKATYYPWFKMYRGEKGRISAIAERQSEACSYLWRTHWFSPEHYFNQSVSELRDTIRAKIKEQASEAKKYHLNNPPARDTYPIDGIEAVLCTVCEISKADDQEGARTFLFSDEVAVRLKISRFSKKLKVGDTVVRYSKDERIIGIDKVEVVDHNIKFIYAIRVRGFKKHPSFHLFWKIPDQRKEIVAREILTDGILDYVFSKLSTDQAFTLVEQMIDIEDQLYENLAGSGEAEKNFGILRKILFSQENKEWGEIAQSITPENFYHIFNNTKKKNLPFLFRP